MRPSWFLDLKVTNCTIMGAIDMQRALYTGCQFLDPNSCDSGTKRFAEKHHPLIWELFYVQPIMISE